MLNSLICFSGDQIVRGCSASHLPGFSHHLHCDWVHRHGVIYVNTSTDVISLHSDVTKPPDAISLHSHMSQSFLMLQNLQTVTKPLGENMGMVDIHDSNPVAVKSFASYQTSVDCKITNVTMFVSSRTYCNRGDYLWYTWKLIIKPSNRGFCPMRY